MALEELLAHPGIWRAADADGGRRPGLPTGHAALDAILPQSGWPRDTLIELIPVLPHLPEARRLPQGIGVLSLLLPVLKQVSAEQQHVALIDPPGMPYAPALAAAGIPLERLLIVDPAAMPRTDAGAALWSFEQIIGSQACALACLWHTGPLSITALRRLKLAAARGRCMGFLVRPGATLQTPSAATLRLKLSPASGPLGDQRLHIDVVRAQGSWRRAQCTLTLWSALCPP